MSVERLSGMPVRRYCFAKRLSGIESQHFETTTLARKPGPYPAFSKTLGGPSAVRIVSPHWQRATSCTWTWRSMVAATCS